tara:strand:+ start:306 stop:971 length:666 start_codon:yes stop_codon:yes gene_type:complete
MSKEKTLESAIQQFRDNIKQSDYVKLGAKGEYLTVPYRIKFVREYFGSRLQLITFSSELANGSTKFRASALLDGKELSVGESKMMVNRDKEFEKAQTVSVGRCLSILGFMGNEIATAEEIEDFIKDKEPIKETKQINEVKKEVVNKKINTQEFAKEWMEKLQTQATLSATLNKFEQGIQVLSKEYKEELDQLYNDPIEDVRVANEYNKLKSQIQNRKSNGR